MNNNNKNVLFFNIIKNSGPDFKFREELIKLHTRNLQLESSINIRKEAEYEYNKLKIKELNERQDEFKFQKKFFIKRNQNILENIQKNNFASLELASASNKVLLDIHKRKDDYQNYLNSILPGLEVAFNTQLFSQNNLLMKEKENEKNKLMQNENRNKYYEELMKMNESLAKEIKNLKKQNYLLSLQNQEKEKLFYEKEKDLINQMNNFNQDENNSTLFQNRNLKAINNMINDNNLNDKDNNNNVGSENLRSGKKIIEPKGNLLMQYALNMNHEYGVLDEIRQKEIDKENEKLRKEFYDLNYQNKIIISDRNSLDDLRKQIIDPKKINNFVPGMYNTLNQNYYNLENSSKNIDIINNNIYNRNIDNNMSVISNQGFKNSESINIINNNIKNRNIDNNKSVISNQGFINNESINIINNNIKNRNIDNNKSVISNQGFINNESINIINNNIKNRNIDNNKSVISNQGLQNSVIYNNNNINNRNIDNNKSLYESSYSLLNSVNNENNITMSRYNTNLPKIEENKEEFRETIKGEDKSDIQTSKEKDKKIDLEETPIEEEKSSQKNNQENKIGVSNMSEIEIDSLLKSKLKDKNGKAIKSMLSVNDIESEI